MSKNHKIAITLITFFLLSVLYKEWYNGLFAFTSEQERQAIVRRIPYFQGRHHSAEFSFLNYIPGAAWSPDTSLIPLVQRNRFDITPLLEDLYKENKDEGVIFILYNVVRTKDAFKVLKDISDQNPKSRIDLFSFIGDSLLAVDEDIDDEKILSVGNDISPLQIGRANRWFEIFNDKLVDADYGVSVPVSNGYLYPLGKYGLFVQYGDGKFSHDYYFPGKTYYYYTGNSVVAIDGYANIERVRQISEENRHRLEVKIDATYAFSEFSHALDKEIANGSPLLPYYPVMAMKFGSWDLLGYMDHNHQPHGLWREYNKDHMIIAKRWFIHGKECDRKDYETNHKFDLPSVFPSTHGEMSAELFKRRSRYYLPNGGEKYDESVTGNYPSFIKHVLSLSKAESKQIINEPHARKNQERVREK